MSDAGVEQLFTHLKADRARAPASYNPQDPEAYESYVNGLILDANDYESSTLAGRRDRAQKYYYGLLPSLNPDGTPFYETGISQNPDATYGDLLGAGENRAPNKSSFVSTDVRDAILLIMPSLVRIFAGSENVVSLIPRTSADVDAAAQQTAYVNYVFWQDNPGFLLLHGAFKDAMTLKAGFIKWWTDNSVETRRKTYININPQQVQMLLGQDQTNKLVSTGNQDPQTGCFDEVVFSYTVDKPLIKCAGVPPQEMRLDRYARTFRDSRIVGHVRLVPVDELVAMGYDRDDCLDYVQGQPSNEFTTEEWLRNEGRAMATGAGDGVLYGEWYVKADRDGDGHAELRMICTFGESYEIKRDVETNRVRFAHFGVDPISHTIVGDSVADLVVDIQRINTGMYRGVLDSLAESITPRTVVNELSTNIDDAMNDEVGAVIRTRGDPSNAVQFSVTPFAGASAVPVIQLLQEVMQRRTGLSDAAKGLDPAALQSSTQLGVQAVINGQQERIELIARVLAETGFKDLFQGLYNEIAEAPNQKRTLRLNGQWADINTSTFDAAMGVEVNSTLGKGSDSTRMMVLSQIKQDQMMVFQQFGPQNPVVGIPEMINTITDMLALSNIKNPQRYFKTPDPQQLQQIMSAPKEPDAMSVAAKAQYEKVRSDTVQALAEQEMARRKQQADDDFRHEQLRLKAANETAKLEIERAKVGMTHDTNLSDIAAAMFKTTMDAHVDTHVAHVQADAQQQQAEAQAAAQSASGPGEPGDGPS